MSAIYALLYLKFNIENAFVCYLHLFQLNIRKRESTGKIQNNNIK